MKDRVTRFKSLAVALTELAPFIRDGQHLETGKPFEKLGGMRSREALANWLICVVNNFEVGGERLTFTSDPQGGDGIIYDTKADRAWPTEHIIVPRPRAVGGSPDIGALIIEAVEKKVKKGGSAYASGKTLVVFLNVGAEIPRRGSGLTAGMTPSERRALVTKRALEPLLAAIVAESTYVPRKCATEAALTPA